MVNHVRTRVIVCPNPECQKKIKEPILLTTPAEHYYACPHCFIELNEYAGPATVEEYLQDARARAVRVRDPLDVLGPNYRFRHP
jgi:hypothetical protein